MNLLRGVKGKVRILHKACPGAKSSRHVRHDLFYFNLVEIGQITYKEDLDARDEEFVLNY